MNNYMTAFVLIDNVPVRANVKRLANGCYRDRDNAGITYPSRKVKQWTDLTDAQKRAAIAFEYDRRLESIEWAIAKDPANKRLRKIWIDALESEYRQHLSDLTPFMD